MICTRQLSYKKGILKITHACILFNTIRGMSGTKGVLLYDQLIRPMTAYSWQICKSDACSHATKLQASLCY